MNENIKIDNVLVDYVLQQEAINDDKYDDLSVNAMHSYSEVEGE